MPIKIKIKANSLATIKIQYNLFAVVYGYKLDGLQLNGTFPTRERAEQFVNKIITSGLVINLDHWFNRGTPKLRSVSHPDNFTLVPN